MNKIKELRREKGLSTRDLASILDLAPMSINYYENDKRDMSTDTLIEISKYFEVTCDYLLGISKYYLSMLYEKNHLHIRINEDDYLKIKDVDVIYFNSNNKICINFNKLVGANEEADLSFMILESVKNKKLNLLFEKSKINKSILITRLENVVDTLPDIDFSLIDIISIKNFFEGLNSKK